MTKKAQKTEKPRDRKEILSGLIGDERRTALTRQVGGQGNFADIVTRALTEAKTRAFADEESAARWCLLVILARCGSVPKASDMKTV